MIEEAGMTDLEAVYALMCELEHKTLDHAHFEKVYRLGLEDENMFYYVYRKDGVVAGFISFQILYYLHHEKATGEIVELCVHPDWRNQKIGASLLDYVESLAKARGLEQIELSTSTYRKGAHRFYERHGFEMLHYNYTKNL